MCHSVITSFLMQCLLQATDKTGLPFQKTILKKLVEWKMQSMF